MGKRLILFGTGKIAEVIFYYAKEECGYDVAAFTVDDAYKIADNFLGLPVIPFSEVSGRYSPDTHDMFVAVGYHDLNKLRATKCSEAEGKGYNLISIISPACNLPKNVSVGRNCFIMPPAVVHPCVTLADNVFVWSGALVGHHTTVEDNCWLTSACHIGGNVRIGANTFVAINATIGHSVSIGKSCFLGANTLVTKNLEDDKAVIAESSKPLRLTSQQFLKLSAFSNL